MSKGASSLGWYVSVMGKARLAATLGAAVLLLAGCSVYSWGETSHVPTREEVIGVWTHPGPDGIVATIEFKEDGSWEANNVPEFPPFEHEEDWSSLNSGHGDDWSIPDTSDGQAPRVDLGVYYGYGFTFIEIDDTDKGVRFFSSLGDPDEGVRFYWDKSD
jgi:hypothetical protein